MRAVTLLLALLLISLSLAGCSGGAPTATSTQANNGGTSGGGSGGGGGGTNPPGVPIADHIFLVVLENHSFSQVVGNPAMPYLNSLAMQNGLAANYYANTHPSIGNYFMLTVGAMESNNDAFSGTVSDDNLVRALTGSGKSWKAYLESLPAVGYT